MEWEVTLLSCKILREERCKYCNYQVNQQNLRCKASKSEITRSQRKEITKGKKLTLSTGNTSYLDFAKSNSCSIKQLIKYLLYYSTWLPEILGRKPALGKKKGPRNLRLVLDSDTKNVFICALLQCFWGRLTAEWEELHDIRNFVTRH